MSPKRLIRRTGLTLAVVIGTAGLARAQDPTPPAQAAPAQPQRGKQIQKDQTANPMEVAQVVQDMLDNMVLSRAQTALALTDDQYPLFFRRMQAYQRLQHQHQMRRLRLIQEIYQLTKPGVTTADDVLAERTKTLDDLETDMSAQERQAMTAIDQTISVRQRARLRVFLENMERAKITLIAQAMQAGGGPGGGRK
jgi:hypothetical protein